MANIKCNVRTCCKRVKVEVNDGSQISKVRSLKRVIRCDDITDDPLSQLVRAIFPCRWTDSLNQWWIVIQYIYEYIWFLWVTCRPMQCHCVMLSAAAEQMSAVLKGKQMAALCSLLSSCMPVFIRQGFLMSGPPPFIYGMGRKKNSTLSNRSQLERCNIIKKD